MSEVLACGVKGCGSAGIFQIEPEQAMTPEHAGYWCEEHLPEGYCSGCGHFCAGIESFDFPSEEWMRGLCEECVQELRAEADGILEEMWEDAWDDPEFEY